MLNQVARSAELARLVAIEDDRIRSFATSIPRTFSDAVERTYKYAKPVSCLVLENRIELAKAAMKFHRDAGTQTTRVSESISALSDPETVVVVSTHQPNLFSYGGVFKKIVLMESLAHALKTKFGVKVVNLFVVVDHDFMDETWVRLAHLPSVDHSGGKCELRYGLRDSQRWLMVCNAPVPERFVISRWKHDVKSWIRRNAESGQERQTCLQRLTELWQDYELAYEMARSYADLNSFFMSRVVNTRWRYGTAFVRLSEMSPVFKKGCVSLLANHATYSRALKEVEQKMMSYGIDTGVSGSSHVFAPVWAHCSCGSKASVKVEPSSAGFHLFGTCIRCSKEILLDTADPEGLANMISPRAIPIPILLANELGVACYASGTGALGYMGDCSVVADSLGVRLPVVAVWSSRDRYLGIGQRRALVRSDSQAEYTRTAEESDRQQHSELERAIKSLVECREIPGQGAGPDPDFLHELFTLKVRQRKIRSRLSLGEKVRGAANMSPCFIDYAINFGANGAEKFWSRHLHANGNLTEEVARASVAV